ncbi:MAG: 5-formyltetrahydrofolate cyclo-ligase [Alphaproteobacteria bacterium]
MNADVKIQKSVMRDKAKRVRQMLDLNKEQQEALCQNFFNSAHLFDGACVASYWPHERELDTHCLMDMLLDRGVTLALPVVQQDTRILRFIRWMPDTPMRIGVYGIAYPQVDKHSIWLEPDIFLVPALAFDQKGYRLGYGGGYYDATLSHYRQIKPVQAIGIAYAEQACLFPLPREAHDQRMDYIITEQSVMSFISEQ